VSDGELAAVEKEIRVEMKASVPELKEKQIKDLLSPKLWRDQKALLDAAKTLRDQLVQQMGEGAIVSGQCDDFNPFDDELKKALKATCIKLDAKQKKQLLDAITWKNPEAERVIKKVLKETAQPNYGAFEAMVNGKTVVVEYQPDSDLRDYENIPLDPTKRVEELIEDYFYREVAPHVPDAWIDANKRDEMDGEIGIVGYEIPFNRHFYVYQPPRSLEEIDADLDKVSADIMSLLQEVHS
ncbi:MAG: SAM-dependent DNA methyltransferase, partial [Oceanospirillales bacterium]|nr:SAM-dependent DNA methyltransferase [Oceanospirillales bacterium]